VKLLLSAILLMTGTAFAADTAPAKNASAAASKTNVSFDELLIQGKYHFSDEAVITVEQDKILDALLGVRKDFKDRLEQSASRQ
jgi:opacity protein-like surface antigen